MLNIILEYLCIRIDRYIIYIMEDSDRSNTLRWTLKISDAAIFVKIKTLGKVLFQA